MSVVDSLVAKRDALQQVSSPTKVQAGNPVALKPSIQQQHHQQQQEEDSFAARPPAVPPVQIASVPNQLQSKSSASMLLDVKSRTSQETTCPHRFYMMPSEFEQDGVLSIWTQKTYQELAAHPCRTMDRDEAAVLVPGIETACPVNWPNFANHRQFHLNYVFINSTAPCHETLETRLKLYWDKHDLTLATTAVPPPPETAAEASGDGQDARAVEHGGRGRGRAGKFFVVFRAGGFPYQFLQKAPFNWKQIILAHNSLAKSHTPSTLQIAYPVMPLTVPADRTIVGRDPCRKRSIFASFQGSNTYKTRKQLLAYSDMSDVVINLQDSTRPVIAVTDESQQSDYQAKYLELLYNSTFTFCVRGHNQFSFRFPEAIASGSIPIILSDNWHLPFSGAPAINYDDFTLSFPEKEVRF